MSIFESDGNTAKLLRETLNKVAGYEPSTLGRPDLEPNGFVEMIPLFERISAHVKCLLALPLENVPSRITYECHSNYEGLLRQYENLSNMRAENYNSAVFNDFRSRLLKIWSDNIYQQTMQLANYCTGESDLTEAVRVLEEATREARAECTDIVQKKEDLAAWHGATNTELNETKRQADAQIAYINEMLKRVGVKHHSELFEEHATSFRWASWWWLAGGSILSGVLMAFALWFLQVGYAQTIKETGTAIVYATNRLFVLSVLSVGIFICIKNYSACRHNCVVNEHRYNALLTFDTFTNSALDDETKKAVLLQVMQTIFAPQPTGYLKTADSQSGPQIIEFIKNTVGSDK